MNGRSMRARHSSSTGATGAPTPFALPAAAGFAWLAGAWKAHANARAVEHLVEHEISPALVRALYQGGNPAGTRYVVRRQQADLVVEAVP